MEVITEIFVDGAWQRINADVRTQDPIVIKRGRANEADQADPATCRLTLNNRAGRYSLRNPLSDLFGKINRNTPLRIRRGPRRAGMTLPGHSGAYAVTPDTAALDITGDIDLRAEVNAGTWRPGAGMAGMARKYVGAGDQRSWAWWITPDGELRVRFSPDGTFASTITVTSTVPIPVDSGRIGIRFTLDVDNGAAGNDASFFTAPSIAGPWAQLGATITTAGATSIFSSTSDLEFGRTTSADSFGVNIDSFVGELFAFELRDGIDGTVVAAPDFTTLEPGTRSFTGTAGLPWTLQGVAAVIDPSIQFAGEVSAWPTRRHRSGHDAVARITASGITRRLGQGRKPLRSSLFRDLSNSSNVAAYWPMEDGKDAARIAPGVGDQFLNINGPLSLAEYDGLVSSAPLPTFNTGTMAGNVPPYTGSDDQRLTVALHLPEDGMPGTSGRRIFSAYTTGTVAEWRVQADSQGRLLLKAFDPDNTLILDHGPIVHELNGLNVLVWLLLRKSGSDIDWQLGSHKQGSNVVGFTNDLLVGHSIGRITRTGFGSIADIGQTSIGHAHILAGDTDTEFWDTVSNSLIAWSGETAGDRLVRLALEEDMPIVITGDVLETEQMGPQRRDTVLNLLRECGIVDVDVFGERRDQRTLWFRLRETLYNQRPALTLDFSSGHVFPPFEPVPDDQIVRNDVTVARPDGGEAQAVLEEGSLSVKDPEDGGIGRYEVRLERNVASDGQLPNQAGWHLHLGTVDEERYPKLQLNLSSPRIAHLVDAILALDEGDRVHIVRTPESVPDPIELIVQGIEKNLNVAKASVTLTCTPASPWSVAVAEDAELGRADTAGARLAADVTATDTTLQVLTTVPPLWTETAAEFPFDVKLGGEIVTVADIVPHMLDRFTRTVASGWGAADSGQSWTTSGGAAADFAVNGTQGLVVLNSVGEFRRCLLGNTDRDVDIMASVATDAVATGAPISARLVARYVDDSNHYMARADFNPSGNVVLTISKVVGGTFTLLAGGFVLGAYAAGERFNVRFVVLRDETGPADSALGAKIWRAGEPEPAFQLFVVDDSLPGAGEVGMRQRLDSGNTNTLVTLSWDDLTSKAQRFTATRSVNGISKAQTAGTDVALAEPAIAAL